jgi:hypothetical protein
MTFYEQMTHEPFSTTAIYPNRLTQKQELESLTNLNETGEKVEIKIPNFVLASGYIRIVYGDHGPYLEFLYDQIVWPSWQCERKDTGFYNKYYPVDDTNILLYQQMRTVKHLCNPPAGPRSFDGYRKEGYADYRVGRLYIDPFQLRKYQIKA